MVTVVAVVVGVAAVALYFGTSPASFRKLSCQVKGVFTSVTAPGKTSLADAGCQESGKDGEIYYVSCGGFF